MKVVTGYNKRSIKSVLNDSGRMFIYTNSHKVIADKFIERSLGT